MFDASALAALRARPSASVRGFDDLPENQQFVWIVGGLGAIAALLIIGHGVLKKDPDSKPAAWGQKRP